MLDIDKCYLDKIIYYPSDSFADCPKVASVPPTVECGWGSKKKDKNPMSSLSSATVITTSDTIERDQRRFLERRLSVLFYEHKAALKRQFGLADDAAPEKLIDILARIKDGKYVLPEKYADAYSYNLMSYIRWRDPSLKEDKEGYDAAKKVLQADYDTAEEAAKLLPITDATKAMQDFKNWKYTAPASA